MRLPANFELKNHVALTFVAGTLIVFGVLLRGQNLGFPSTECWDEEHFVRNARPYLGLGLDLNDHPPLGKLLIAGGMRVFGDSSFGWRVVPMLFGVLAIALAWELGSELFDNWRAGMLAAALVAADGFFIAYSRTALLDGMLTALLMASALLLTRARGQQGVLGACVLMGLAASIKFSGIVIAPAVLWVTLSGKRVPRWSVLHLLSAGLVYYACFAMGLRIMHLPWSPLSVWKATRGLLAHHAALTSMLHPATSHWYSWWLPTRPIILYYSESHGWVRALTTLGNPLSWWASLAAMLATVIASAWSLARRLQGQPEAPGGSGFFARHGGAAAALLGLWILPLLPWILTRRDSYIYHYLPSYAFALILLGGLAAWLYERRSLLALAALLCIGEVSVYYAPLWGELPVSHAGYEQRLFVASWR